MHKFKCLHAHGWPPAHLESLKQWKWRSRRNNNNNNSCLLLHPLPNDGRGKKSPTMVEKNAIQAKHLLSCPNVICNKYQLFIASSAYPGDCTEKLSAPPAFQHTKATGLAKLGALTLDHLKKLPRFTMLTTIWTWDLWLCFDLNKTVSKADVMCRSNKSFK